MIVKNPRISVLMSVYKEPLAWLKESIKSILSQTEQDFEFIIINDGEHGENYQYLLYLAEKHDCIHLIDNPVNVGLTKSLNKGLSIVKGQFVARMDADDICKGDRFAKQLDFMLQHEDIAAVGSYAITFGENSKKAVIGIGCGKNYNEIRTRMLYCNAGPVHSSAFIRTKFLRKYHIVYDETIKKSQDYKLWTDVVKNGGKLAIIPETLIRYRVHGGQISQAASKEQTRYFQLIQEQQLKEIFGHDLFSDYDMECHLCLSRCKGHINLDHVIAYADKLIQCNKENLILPQEIFEIETKKRLFKYALRREDIQRVRKILDLCKILKLMNYGVFRNMVMDARVKRAKDKKIF